MHNYDRRSYYRFSSFSSLIFKDLDMRILKKSQLVYRRDLKNIKIRLGSYCYRYIVGAVDLHYNGKTPPQEGQSVVNGLCLRSFLEE